MTGKGFPDLNTRQLLWKLAFEIIPQAAFLCLVDGNPYGMEIMSVYKFGSLSMVWCGEHLASDSCPIISLSTLCIHHCKLRLKDFLP